MARGQTSSSWFLLLVHMLFSDITTEEIISSSYFFKRLKSCGQRRRCKNGQDMKRRLWCSWHQWVHPSVRRRKGQGRADHNDDAAQHQHCASVWCSRHSPTWSPGKVSLLRSGQACAWDWGLSLISSATRRPPRLVSQDGDSRTGIVSGGTTRRVSWLCCCRAQQFSGSGICVIGQIVNAAAAPMVHSFILPDGYCMNPMYLIIRRRKFGRF